MLKKKLNSQIKATDSNFEISKLFRHELQTYKISAKENFHKESSNVFLLKHCKQIDTYVKLIYSSVLKRAFKDYPVDMQKIPINFYALGSYARMHMSMYSDIDLMIVYEDIEGFNVIPILESFLHIAWDSKLDIAHRVHDLNKISTDILEDPTIQTAIFESRMICGSDKLHQKFKYELSQIKSKHAAEFIETTIKEYNSKDHSRDLCMEFDIKNSIGTLRDMNMLMWLASCSADIPNIKGLYQKKICTYKEFKTFKEAIDLLLFIRFSLHALGDKKQDILSLECYPDLIKTLSFKNQKNLRTQTALSKKLYESINTIYTFCKVHIAQISSNYLKKYALSYLKNNRISKGFYVQDNIVFTHLVLNARHEKEFLNNLVHLPDKVLYFDGSIYKILMSLNKQEVSAYFKNPNIIIGLFQRKHLFSLLKLFYHTEILQYVFTIFKNIFYLGQFDGFHKYPVGYHSIKVVESLENITDNNIASIYRGLTPSDKVLVKYCTLFHDVGKGKDSDHSFLGAEIFAKSAKENGFSSNDIKDGKTLIKHHILMSAKAYKDDIYDEHTIVSFCSALGSKRLIDMLYVLTYADHLGTNPSALSSHKKHLLQELYTQSIQYIDNEEILELGRRRIKKEEALKKDLEFGELEKSMQKKVFSISSDLLFVKYAKKDIINIATRALNDDDYTYKIENEKFLSIEIIRKIPLNLGYLLNRLSYMSVGNMDIYRLFDNKKYFKVHFAQKIDDSGLQQVENIIEQSFDMSKQVDISKVVISPENISLDENHSKYLAKMIITGKNQKGFLAFIAKIFDDMNIDIQGAKIHTSRSTRIQDLLLIEKNESFFKNIEATIKMLTQNI